MLRKCGQFLGMLKLILVWPALITSVPHFGREPDKSNTILKVSLRFLGVPCRGRFVLALYTNRRTFSGPKSVLLSLLGLLALIVSVVSVLISLISDRVFIERSEIFCNFLNMDRSPEFIPFDPTGHPASAVPA